MAHHARGSQEIWLTAEKVAELRSGLDSRGRLSLRNLGRAWAPVPTQKRQPPARADGWML